MTPIMATAINFGAERRMEQDGAGRTKEFSLQFHRSFDAERIRRILTHPKVYPSITDDGCPPHDQYVIPDPRQFLYVMALDRGELLGCFAFQAVNSICYDVHTCLLPHAIFPRGRPLAAARGVVSWIWQNTPCRRIITRVPTCNPLALHFARKAGMIMFGTNERSWLKGGKLHDQIYLGISKPEVT